MLSLSSFSMLIFIYLPLLPFFIFIFIEFFRRLDAEREA